MEELIRALGRIEGRLVGIENEQKRIADYAISTSTRVGTLERAEAHSKGLIAGMSAFVSLVVALVVAAVKAKFGSA